MCRDRNSIQEILRKADRKKKVMKVILILGIIIFIVLTTHFCLKTNQSKRENEQNLTNNMTQLENNYNDINNSQEEMINKQNEQQQQIQDLNSTVQQLNETITNLNNELEQVKISKQQKKEQEEKEKSLRVASVSSRSATSERVSNTGEWISGNISAYCSCRSCCGSYANGITAMGTTATQGRTIAAPSNYPFGTKIEIEGYGIYTVEDRGGAIKGNKLDVYMNSHSAALSFGRKNLRFRVVS